LVRDKIESLKDPKVAASVNMEMAETSSSNKKDDMAFFLPAFERMVYKPIAPIEMRVVNPIPGDANHVTVKVWQMGVPTMADRVREIGDYKRLITLTIGMYTSYLTLRILALNVIMSEIFSCGFRHRPRSHVTLQDLVHTRKRRIRYLEWEPAAPRGSLRTGHRSRRKESIAMASGGAQNNASAFAGAGRFSAASAGTKRKRASVFDGSTRSKAKAKKRNLSPLKIPKWQNHRSARAQRGLRALGKMWERRSFELQSAGSRARAARTAATNWIARAASPTPPRPLPPCEDLARPS
jgi:hypothetical protein